MEPAATNETIYFGSRVFRRLESARGFKVGTEGVRCGITPLTEKVHMRRSSLTHHCRHPMMVACGGRDACRSSACQKGTGSSTRMYCRPYRIGLGCAAWYRR